MKTKEEILESGILEQYVLGLTTEAENKVVMDYISRYPQLRSHLSSIEDIMEKIAIQNAIEPPEAIKSNTIKKIEKIEMQQKKTGKYAPWIGIAAALFCLAAVVAAFTSYKSMKKSNAALAALEQNMDTLTENCEKINEANQKTNRLLVLYESEFHTPVLLRGNEKLPNSSVTVFWGDSGKGAYVKADNIANSAEGTIYQIWADIEGEMISLGTFNQSEELIPIKYFENAESLNVTIENGQGSDHPDVSRLVMNRQV